MKLSILKGNIFDKIKEIQDESVDLVITSPPYWGLRNYNVEGQLGLEPTMEAYLDNTLKWVKEVWRVLKPKGSFILNIGDTFSNPEKGHKQYAQGENSIYKDAPQDNEFVKIRPKGGIYKSRQLLSVSSFAYCKIISETDFVCRGEHIWCKPNVPSPIRSRLKHSHEKVFWFVKDPKNYYFDEKPWLKKVTESSKAPSLRATLTTPLQGTFSNKEQHENLRNKEKPKYEETIEHSWRIIPVGEKQQGFELSDKTKQEHIAPFPTTLIEPYISSLCPNEGVILDPFLGSGTTMRVAMENHRDSIGIELNDNYIKYAKARLNWGMGLDTEYYES